MESTLLLPALSLPTLNSARDLLKEYLEQYFQMNVEVHSVTTEQGRGLSFVGSRELALFWERELSNLVFLDGLVYLSQSPLDEMILQDMNIDYSIFNWALFVKQIPDLDTHRINKIKEGWRFLRTCFSPSNSKPDSSYPAFFKYIAAEQIIGLKTGFAVKIDQSAKYPDISLDQVYQDFIRMS